MFKNRVNITTDITAGTIPIQFSSFHFPSLPVTQVVSNAPVKILNEGIDLQIQTRTFRVKVNFNGLPILILRLTETVLPHYPMATVPFSGFKL